MTTFSPLDLDDDRLFPDSDGKPMADTPWQEDNIPPQVVFEIRFPSNTDMALTRKQEFYETYGVEEYYLYDPETNRCDGWLRQQDRLVPISDLNDWISPRLQIRFHPGSPELTLYDPDGRKFLSSIELEQRAHEAEQRAREAEQRAASATSALEQERQRAEQLAAYLHSLRDSEEQLPEV